MILNSTQVTELLSRHVCDVSEEEFKAIGYLLSVQVDEYQKTPGLLKLRLTHKTDSAYMECEPHASFSMGFNPKAPDKLTRFTAWAPQKKLCQVFRVFIFFYVNNGYQAIPYFPTDTKYLPGEMIRLTTLADGVIFSNQFNPK